MLPTVTETTKPAVRTVTPAARYEESGTSKQDRAPGQSEAGCSSFSDGAGATLDGGDGSQPGEERRLSRRWSGVMGWNPFEEPGLYSFFKYLGCIISVLTRCCLCF